MWQAAGASIVSVPSNEVYNALQTGVAEATDTSTGSFVSFRIYEQVKCITAPGDNALWFMYEPVLMSKKSVRSASTSSSRTCCWPPAEGQKTISRRKRKGLDDEMVKAFKEHNVEVRHAHARRVRRTGSKVAQAELVRRVRQGSAGRQEADRRRRWRSNSADLSTSGGWHASRRAVI